MTPLLIVLLAMLWGAVLIPAILRARQDTSPIVSVGSFRRSMRALGKRRRAVGGRWIVVPTRPRGRPARGRAIDRRRRVFSALAFLALATFLLGLLPWWRGLLKVNLVVDLMLAGYVAFLITVKRRKDRAPAYQPKHSHRRSKDRERQYLEAQHF